MTVSRAALSSSSSVFTSLPEVRSLSSALPWTQIPLFVFIMSNQLKVFSGIDVRCRQTRSPGGRAVNQRGRRLSKHPGTEQKLHKAEEKTISTEVSQLRSDARRRSVTGTLQSETNRRCHALIWANSRPELCLLLIKVRDWVLKAICSSSLSSRRLTCSDPLLVPHSRAADIQRADSLF